MKVLTLIFTFCACFSSLYASEPNKREALKRLSLMSYVIHLEAQQSYDLKWDKLTTSYFNIFSKAHAYKEGDPCLILGFQSVYSGGMCRLSKAVDAKQFKNSCRSGEYACNPQVFGTNREKPFCVSASIGSELSKYCAHKSIISLSQVESLSKYSNKTQEALVKITKTDPRDFNFEMVLAATDDNKFNESFNALYIDPYTLKKSQEFTTSLCSAIQSSGKSKAHSLDLSSCDAQLKLLSSTATEETDEDEVDDDELKANITLHDTKPKTDEVEDEVENNTKIVTSDLLIEDTRKVCAPEIEKTDSDKNIEDIKDITNNLEANFYTKCVNELFYHKDLPVEARGQYFHKLGDKISFAKQCWSLDKHGEKEILYSFVSEDGFKMLNYPVYNYTIPGTDTRTSHPRNMFKFYDGNKPYYLSRFDNIGQYFDSLPEDQLSDFVTERDLMVSESAIQRKYIKPYENYLIKDGKSKKIQLTTPEEAGYTTEQAKSCLKERLIDYVNIMMFRSYDEVFPYTKQLNADLAVYPRSSLRHKYSKTSGEIKKELIDKILNKSSACRSVFSESDYTKAFEKAYGKRLENYNEFRHYFLE